jgi:hypothetical protein
MFSEEVAEELIPRMFKVKLELGPAVELHITTHEVGFEQRHAATDIATDEVRVDHAFGHEGRTDG